MLRFLGIFLIAVICRAAIVPQENNNPQTKQQPSATSTVNNQVQRYPATQGNRLQQYYYPSYPDYSSNGYAVQSGYEGYLFPTYSSTQKNAQWSSDFASSLIPFSGTLLSYGARAGSYLFHFLLIIILGGLFTTLICTFTPLCTISFLGLGLTKNQVKEQVVELARAYITPESLNAATVLVTKAIDKYTAMQREKREKEMETKNQESIASSQ